MIFFFVFVRARRRRSVPRSLRRTMVRRILTPTQYANPIVHCCPSLTRLARPRVCDRLRVHPWVVACVCVRVWVFVCVRLRGCVCVHLCAHERGSVRVFCVRACLGVWLECVCIHGGARVCAAQGGALGMLGWYLPDTKGTRRVLEGTRRVLKAYSCFCQAVLSQAHAVNSGVLRGYPEKVRMCVCAHIGRSCGPSNIYIISAQ